MPDVPELLVVGRVERPHGLAGEVSASVLTDFPERFSAGSAFLWKRGGQERRLTLSAARAHGKRLLLVFEGVEDADAARALSGGDLCVAAEAAFPAPEGFFYDHEIRGWTCEDARGRRLGEAAGLERTPAGPLLSVETRPGKVALVPFVDGIVIEVDRAGRRIVLDPPEGLMELTADSCSLRSRENIAPRSRRRCRSRSSPSFRATSPPPSRRASSGRRSRAASSKSRPPT